MEQYVIPIGMDDPRSKALTAEVYKSQMGPALRALYHTHEILFASPEAWRAFPNQYKTAQARYLSTNPREGYFDPRVISDPKPFTEIKDAYQKSLAAGAPKFDQSAAFRWLADYVTVVENDDSDMAYIAGGFWMRRSIDGTEAQIFRLVKKMLQTFEPLPSH